MPSTPHLCEPPVHPPDLVGVLEANFYRLPLDREHLLVPYSPDPARLYPLGEPLRFGQVPLHVARRTLPLPHLLYPSTCLQVALADLSTHLVPGRGYETT